jgi:hypothetical protein
MDYKLNEIKILSEKLATAIGEYFKETERDRIIVRKDEFHNIKHLGKLNSYRHVFEFYNGILFTLADSGDSYAYEKIHFTKLLSGELDRLILIKKNVPFKADEYWINYELEPIEKTKLFDSYPKPNNE